jgi:hypothetical protein
MITRLISLGNVIIDIVAKVPTYQALMWSMASNG